MKHVAQIAKAGKKGTGLYAAWCSCGHSTPLGAEPQTKQSMTEHFHEVGGGEWKGGQEPVVGS